VTQDFPPERGGIQTFMFELAKALLTQGHSVRVICPGEKTDPDPFSSLPKNAEHGNIGRVGRSELVRLRIHSSWLFLRLITYLPSYLKKNPAIEVVLYAQWQCALGELFIPQHQKRHRSYSMIMGRELLTSVLGPLAPFFRRRAFQKLQGAFPISAEIFRLTRKMAPHTLPLQLLHPGVDPTFFKPVDAGFLRDRYHLENAPVIYSITRMVARKNLQRLIEAMPQILKSVPNAKLVLAGSGPEKQNLENLVSTLALENSVQFLGSIKDDERVAHYCMANVFALPSMSLPRDIEGFGIVFLEAGACEVAVVGSLAGGIPDAVEANVGGLLVPPDATEKIADAIIQLLQNPARAKDMGERARARIEQNFTWKHIAEKLALLVK